MIRDKSEELLRRERRKVATTSEKTYDKPDPPHLRISLLSLPLFPATLPFPSFARAVLCLVFAMRVRAFASLCWCRFAGA